ncbi:MAG: glycoside hydrolase family 88/105 protein [Bacteroidota bacterium]
MKTIALFALSLMLISSCTSPQEDFWPKEKSPEKVAGLVTTDLLSRDNYMMYLTEHVKAMHYAEVCAAFGAARFAGLVDDTITINNLAERYSLAITDTLVNTANHVDANVYGILPLELFRQGKDSAFFRQGIRYADMQWDNPLPGGLTRQIRYWIDDVYMINSLQIQAYRITGDHIYLDRAADVTVDYLDTLQQPNGLFHHGPNAPFFWGRGNGWVAAGLAELIAELPENHQHYSRIVDGYSKMMAALLDYQAEDGMWRQLVDVDTSWKETSCTGMFGYAMTVGVDRGILPEGPYKETCRKAWLSLTDYLGEDGKISDVCVGTGQSKDIEYYLNRPTVAGDFHGQAPLLWFAWALMK